MKRFFDMEICLIWKLLQYIQFTSLVDEWLQYYFRAQQETKSKKKKNQKQQQIICNCLFIRMDG